MSHSLDENSSWKITNNFLVIDATFEWLAFRGFPWKNFNVKFLVIDGFVRNVFSLVETNTDFWIFYCLFIFVNFHISDTT